ncbi:MAG TPA: hypothetical protein VFN61_00085 [Acidimicrobiales bacterium]|nr:hypothetical protein [Acidimicrobiales bacterium]
MPNAVVARAPVRGFDAGGWTDTWFSGHGAVCHLALAPGAEVLARVLGHTDGASADVTMRVAAYGDHYRFDPDRAPGRHPLLEAVIRRWAPRGSCLEIHVSSPVPAGSSLGTSAAVTVSLLTAMRGLADDPAISGPTWAAEVARLAHEVETNDLGRQSGVQDQVAAAFGGANLVEVSPYPEFQVEHLSLPPKTVELLNNRCFTVYLGAMHDSSSVHSTVIAGLEADRHRAEDLLAPLREAALRAAQALAAADLGAYGDAMSSCTRSQAQLHPSLVNPLAHEIIARAERFGAAGCKVNGAGGPGGTVSIVGPEDPEPLKAALRELAGVSTLDLTPCPNGAHLADAS